MQAMLKIPSTSTLTDFSFVEYKPSTDLYDLLLSDNSELIDLYSNDSCGEKQLTLGESVNGKQMTDFSETEEVQPKKVSTRCNCTKSKCQKNYCQCFRAGNQCSSECSCFNCQNEHQHVHKEPKKASQSGGCNCRKTHCQKKYCQCHSRGVKCTSKCNCIGCENTEIEKSEEESLQENPFVVIDAFYL